jgi:sodium/proline symporter
VTDLVIHSFLLFLGIFLLIGLLSIRKRQKSTEDYLLAGRQMNPAFVGLSGAASTASGFGFTGIIGFGYVMGLSGWWFIFGIVVGSWVAYMLTARRLRTYSERYKTASYTEFLGFGLNKREGGSMTRKHYFPVVVGLISLVAVTLYATAQLTAGSKALHVLFGWNYNSGAILGAVIVLIYCWAGGIRASIWTDVAQIIVMYGAMALLLYVSLKEIGGVAALYEGLRDIDPALVSWFPATNPFGPLLFILGCLSVGVSFIGFPHVMVRFMTLKRPKDTKKALAWYEGSYAAFYITAYAVALCTRVLVPDAATFDKELALADMAQLMLPPVLVGVILAGIFAGTISTADSLILSGTANISRDLFHHKKESYGFLKFATLGVTAAALLIAVSGNQSVFDLVMFVIAIMGAGFAPLLAIRVFHWPITEKAALFMMGGGLITAIFWRFYGLHVYIFDTLPGMLVASIIYGAWYVLIGKKSFKK